LDGVVERYVKVVENHLKHLVSNNQTDWDQKLPLFLVAYRATTHETTDMTAGSIGFRRKLRLL
jgi:hypothetical protein